RRVDRRGSQVRASGQFRIPEVVLGALMAVAIFAMGSVFGSLQSPGNQKQSEAGAREKQSWWTDATADFTLGLVIVGLLQIGLFYFQLKLIRRSVVDAGAAAAASHAAATAATKQAKIAEDSFAKLERPYLYITDVSAFILDRKSSIGDPVFYVTYTV